MSPIRIALTLMILGLFTLGSFAQAPEGINYQAVARDASGNVMNQESITVRVGIFRGAGAATKAYEETHNVTTNQFGLFTFVIGTGNTTFGTFSATDWGSAEHHLKVEVNTGGGFTDMGTTELQSVPYSLYAKEAGSVDNLSIGQLTDVDVTGVSNDKVLKWNGTNWVPADDVGMTTVISNSTLDGDGTATNNLRIAQQGATNGQVLKWNGTSWSPAVDNTGSTYNAGTGIGISGNTITNTKPDQTVTLSGTGATTISGNYPNFTISSTDNNTTYSGGTGITLSGTTFNAQNTTAFWNANKLQGNSISTATPATNDILKWDGNEWIPASNTLTSNWQKNGSFVFNLTDSIGIGVSQPLAGLQIGGNKNVVFGDDTSGIGNRFMWIPNKGSIRAGYVQSVNWNADNIGKYSIAFGYNTKAKGFGASAIGFNTSAPANYSTAMGNGTTASGDYSTATGIYTTASADYSTAMGASTTASGRASTAMGDGTTAPSASETAIGSYNTTYTPLSATTWNTSDRLFVIGNGTFSSQSDAMVVLKNGRTGIGTSNPNRDLHVDHGRFFGSGLRLSNNFTSKSWDFYVSQSTDVLRLYYEGLSRGEFNATSGNYASTSDERLKMNIKDLKEGMLHKVMQLQPKKYQYLSAVEERYFYGFLAQELKIIIPEVVSTLEDDGSGEEDLHLVSYSELIPVLVAAIQEQQEQIEAQTQENHLLKEQVQEQELRLLEFSEALKQQQEQIEILMRALDR